jgi:hypothetical protein
MKLRRQLSLDPYYHVCARKGLHRHQCGGRITWEHALIHAGKQIQERFAIIPLCAKAHAVDHFQDGGDLSKEINQWIALNRANDDELLAISKAEDYFLRRAMLNKKYGKYHVPEHDAVSSQIIYPWMLSRHSLI